MCSDTLQDESPPDAPTLARLVQALQSLLDAPDTGALERIVPSAARELCGAEFGALILREGDHCRFLGEEDGRPAWHGQRLSAQPRVGGWDRLMERELLIPDTQHSPQLPQLAESDTVVKSLLLVPLGKASAIGAIGCYWSRPGGPQGTQLHFLRQLAQATTASLQRLRLQTELEQQLRSRAIDLERTRAELHKHTVTDEMTGLTNRRGFYLLAEQALRHAKRRGVTCMIAFLDIDGLTHINETLGHDVGDALLLDMALLLRKTFRASDLVARMGGDEFCVLALDPGDDALVIRRRIDNRLEGFNRRSQKPYRLSASLGIVCSDPDVETTLDAMLARADESMYQEKSGKQVSRLRSVIQATAA